MPVYAEMIKDKNGKNVEKKINGKTVYYIRTYVENSDGKRKQITRHNKTWLGRSGYDEAQREEIRLKNNVCSDKNGKILLHELAKHYLENSKINWKESTYLKNRDNYRLFIKPKLGSYMIQRLTTKDILEWKNELKKKGYALHYLKGIYSTFSAILNFGCKYYNLEKNVVRIEGNFKDVKGSQKKEMKIITDEQFKNAIKNEKNYFYFVAFNLMFYCGLRRGEMLALKIEDIDFKNNTISINKTVNPKISKVPTPPKTNKSNRIIPVSENIIRLLKSLIENNSFDDDFIFLHHIALTTLKKKSDRNLKSIGLDEDKLIRIHDYRHSFASFCINNNVEIQILSDYMGHENISITWDIYGHLYPDAKYSLINKIKDKIIIENFKF